MPVPASVTPQERWLYVSRIDSILGTDVNTVNEYPQMVEELLCRVYAGGYTGIFFYGFEDSTYRSSGATTFYPAAKAKIADFIERASQRGIVVGGTFSSNQNQALCFIDYNNNYATANQRFSALAVENEWWWWSFNSSITKNNSLGPGAVGTYSFTSMKANLSARKGALNAAGIRVYLYTGWSKSNGEVYNTQPGMDGSTVTGGDEISQLNNTVIDCIMIHNYAPYNVAEQGVIGYSRTRDRMRQITSPMDVTFIMSAEPDFSSNFLQGKNSAGTLLYPLKNQFDCWDYYTTNKSASGAIPGSPLGSSTYFNGETNVNVVNNVNLIGITTFSDRWLTPDLNGAPVAVKNGPQIWIDAGDDITNNTIPGSVSLSAYSCDDGLPLGRTFTYQWTIQSGPSGGSFSASTNKVSDFSYTQAGVYVLRITVSDGSVSSYDELTVFVGSAPSVKTLNFYSLNPVSGVPFTVSIPDNNGNQNGTTAFTRVYNDSDTPVITAPATYGSGAFFKWQRDGIDFSFNRVLTVSDNQSHDYTAVYTTVYPEVQVVQITSNYPDSTFTVNIPDVNGDPVGLSGVVVSLLDYPLGQPLTFTVPSVHPINGTAFLYYVVNGVAQPPGTTLNYTVLATNNIQLQYDDEGDYFIATPTVQDQYCPGLGGECRITVSSPGTYTYLWSNGAVTSVISAPGAGTYTCLVTETSGLYPLHPSILFTNMTIESPVPVSATIGIVNATCENPLGYAIAIPSGGHPPYTYLWSNGATAQFINAAAGAYTVTVTDNNSCNVVEPAVIGTDSIPALLGSLVTQPNCSAVPLGRIDIQVVGGSLPYTYLWTKSGDPGFIAPDSNQCLGLDAGSYSCLVTDDNGCSNTFGPFVIDVQPPLVVVAGTHLGANVCEGTDITMYIDSVTKGGIAQTVSSILWSTGGTALTEPLGILPIGSYNYSVTVTTDSGCVETVYIVFDVVASPTDPLVITLDVPPTTCGGSNYDMSVTGTGSYSSFVWVPTGETTPTISNPSSTIVAPTEFYVVGYGPGGCSNESNRIMVDPAPPTTITIDSVTNNACGGALNTGAIDVDVTGGCPPYTYSWTGPGGFTAITQDISGLVSGDYTLTATDSLLVDAVETITVYTSGPEISGVVTNTGCPGTQDGEINVTVTGGTPPYTYLWSNGATTQDITGLGVGVYLLTVTDDNGCEDEFSFLVGGSDPITASFRVRNPSEGQGNGEITVNPQGGSGTFTYLWNTGESYQTLTNLSAGTYTVEITDTNGCQCVASVTLLDENQEALALLQCCAADVAYLYVWQMKNGMMDKAACTAERLILLRGYISDLCRYQDGNCLSEDQLNTIRESAKEICKCCPCGGDVYDDTLLP